jgi:hypothetical protein
MLHGLNVLVLAHPYAIDERDKAPLVPVEPFLAQPAAGGANVSAPASAVVSAAPAQSVAVATTVPSVAPVSGGSDCPAGLTSGHQKYTLDGFEAWHMCGPATASVTLGGTTRQIASGSCTINAAGYAVAIGTQLYGSPDPSLEPDLLVILADPTTGSGSISGVVAHKHWLLNGSVVYGAGKLNGTFAGTTLVPGTAVHGSFTCQ